MVVPCFSLKLCRMYLPNPKDSMPQEIYSQKSVSGIVTRFFPVDRRMGVCFENCRCKGRKHIGQGSFCKTSREFCHSEGLNFNSVNSWKGQCTINYTSKKFWTGHYYLPPLLLWRESISLLIHWVIRRSLLGWHDLPKALFFCSGEGSQTWYDIPLWTSFLEVTPPP